MAKKPVMGVVFQIQVAGVYTSVAQMTDLSEKDRGGENFESTSFDSTPDSNGNIWKEKTFSGEIDPGKVSYELFYDPTLSGHHALFAMEYQQTNCKTIFPASGGASCLFTSATAKFGREYKMGEGLKMSADLDLTGVVTEA
jgi:hypothetical protein